MKNTIIIAGLVVLTACGGKKDEGQSQDTVLIEEQATIENVETSAKPSEAEIRQQFDNAIAMTVGKKTEKWEPESSIPTISLPVTITNNTDVTLSPSDYKITYTETYEDTVDGELVDKSMTNKVEGPEIPANSSVEYTITKRAQDISNPKVSLTISFDDFSKKY